MSNAAMRLMKFGKSRKQYTESHLSNRLEDCNVKSSFHFKAEGDKALQNYQYVDAVRFYSDEASILEKKYPTDKKEISVIYSKMSYCYYMLSEYRSSHKAANKSLELDPENMDAKAQKARLSFHNNVALTEKEEVTKKETTMKRTGSRVINWIRDISKRNLMSGADIIDICAGKGDVEEGGISGYCEERDVKKSAYICDRYDDDVEPKRESQNDDDSGNDNETVDFDSLLAICRRYDAGNDDSNICVPHANDNNDDIPLVRRKLTELLLPSLSKMRIVSPSSSSSQDMSPKLVSYHRQNWLTIDLSTKTTLPESLVTQPETKNLHLKIGGSIYLLGLRKTFPVLESLVISETAGTSSTDTTIYESLKEIAYFHPTLTHLELNLSDCWMTLDETDVLSSFLPRLVNLKKLRLRHWHDGTAEMLKCLEMLERLEHLQYEGTNAVTLDDGRRIRHRDENFSACRALYSEETTLDLSKLTKLKSVTFVGCSFCAPFEDQPRMQALVLPDHLESVMCLEMYGSLCSEVFRIELEKQGVRLIEAAVPLPNSEEDYETIVKPFWKKVDELEGGVWMDDSHDYM